jgi:hypothetical protein
MKAPLFAVAIVIAFLFGGAAVVLSHHDHTRASTTTHASTAPPGTTYADGVAYGKAAPMAKILAAYGSLNFCAGADPSPGASSDVTTGGVVTGTPWFTGCYQGVLDK